MTSPESMISTDILYGHAPLSHALKRVSSKHQAADHVPEDTYKLDRMERANGTAASSSVRRRPARGGNALCHPGGYSG